MAVLQTRQMGVPLLAVMELFLGMLGMVARAEQEARMIAVEAARPRVEGLAPSPALSIVQNGPATICVQSMTRIPSRGFVPIGPVDLFAATEVAANAGQAAMLRRASDAPGSARACWRRSAIGWRGGIASGRTDRKSTRLNSSH